MAVEVGGLTLELRRVVRVERDAVNTRLVDLVGRRVVAMDAAFSTRGDNLSSDEVDEALGP